MIISRETESPFTKFPHLWGEEKKKTSQKLEIKRNFLNMINCILKKNLQGIH